MELGDKGLSQVVLGKTTRATETAPAGPCGLGEINGLPSQQKMTVTVGKGFSQEANNVRLGSSLG